MTLHDQLSKMIADAEDSLVARRVRGKFVTRDRKIIALAKRLEKAQIALDVVMKYDLVDHDAHELMQRVKAALLAPLEVEE